MHIFNEKVKKMFDFVDISIYNEKVVNEIYLISNCKKYLGLRNMIYN